MEGQGVGTVTRDLDLSAERVWPPARVALLDGWRCRLDCGVTRRANSVLAMDWTGADLERSLTAVEALYLELGLAPCFQITAGSRPQDLDRILEVRGYGIGGLSLVQPWLSVLKQMLHTDVVFWSPFENVQLDHPNVIPDDISGQATRFAAAMGAVIGGLEDL